MQNAQISDDLIGQRTRRIQNMQALTAMGIPCYPAQSQKDVANRLLKEKYHSYEDKNITIAGRITGWRTMGKIIFAEIEDSSGPIQICIRHDEIKSTPPKGLGWSELKLLDLFDFIQVTGKVGKTQAGEITVFADELKILAKAIRPRPNTLDDKESRYRRRYLDLTMHKDARAIFERKAMFWDTIRHALKAENFTEIFVPVLEHTTGGADAKPFITHHNALDQDLYLRISVELYSKRAIASGFEKVFSIGPVFRNEGMSDEHANEYNHIEWYWAYADYRDQMALTRKVMIDVAKSVYGKTEFETRGHKFNLQSEWQEIDYTEVIKEKYGIDIFDSTDEEIKAKLIEKKVHIEEGAMNRQRLIDTLWKMIRKDITGPAFLIHEPAFMSPLSKPVASNPKITERFHVVIAGTELANGYSEINDPIYQLEQFQLQQSMRDSGDDEAQMLDIDFVEMLEYGMPPTTGLGFSERLFWFFENVSAREGTMFPQLKMEYDSITKKIYPFLEKHDFLMINKDNKHRASIVQSSKTPSTLPFSKDQAVILMSSKIANKGLQNHCLSVGMAMKSLAMYFHAEDADLWELAGILHDADWEVTKQDISKHTRETVRWIEESANPKAKDETAKLIRLILSHNCHDNGEPMPQSLAEWSLYCCDELTGLIVATTLIMPSKKLSDVTTESVIKKINSKNFAAVVDREGIRMCEEKLGIPLADFVRMVLEEMQAESSVIGL